jgi:hypothetical protein
MLRRALAKIGLAGPYRAALLIAPEYESITSKTCQWLAVRIPRGVRCYASVGARTSRHDVENALAATVSLNTVIVFFGHGNEDALLGPPQGIQSDVVIDSESFSKIYDSTMISSEQNALFAYCCRSGLELGPAIKAKSGSFLGFTSNVFLILDDDDQECTAAWRMIIRTVAARILRDGVITEKHEELLHRLYDRYLSYFQYGKGKTNRENAFYMMLSLNEQKVNLCRY